LPLARKNLKSEVAKARSHCGIGQRLVVLLRRCRRPLRWPISRNAKAYAILDLIGPILISSRSISA
jgi:hypothetical protein